MNEAGDWRSSVYRKVHPESGLALAAWRLLRDRILARDSFTCLRCDTKFRYKKYLSVHHLVPRAEGGSNDPSNLVTLCQPCHDFVEINDLRIRARIIGSLETSAIVIQRTKDDDQEDDPYNRPAWHRWVYGGGRNPAFDKNG